MKKTSLLLLLLALVLCWSTCCAEILPPYGEGQIGKTAVVLCESLTIRTEQSASSPAVKTLKYGDRIIVQNQKDGWADCFLSDGVDDGPAGWVNSDYIIVDPAWYRTDEATPVYAWNETTAPRVALLDKDTTLPILKDDGDWLIVSLRGAVGWIHKTADDLMNTDITTMEGVTVESVMISVSDGEHSVVYELNNTPAAQSLLSQLPLTIDVQNYGSNEKIFYPEPLSTEDSIDAEGGSGVLAYFSPWDDVVMFYGDFDKYPGLIALGKAIDGEAEIASLSGTITIKVVDAGK